MKFDESDFGRFSLDMQNINNFMGEIEKTFGQKKENQNDTANKANCPFPLSKDETKAFLGLCSIEGITIKEKIAELIKDYIAEKRKQIKK